MAILSRRSVLAFALLGTLVIPPSVALASQMWQSTCVTCGNQSTHFTKNSPTFTRVNAGRKVQRARAAVRPDVALQSEMVGWERALIYEVCLTTGLRKGEVASLTIDSLDLAADEPALTLRGVHAKNGKRCSIPLGPDVAAHLRDWVEGHRRRATERGAGLAAGTPLFRVPTGLIRIFDKDLAAAGIPKVDERGCQVDVHAMRTTFNTQLAVAGVDPRTAMAAMRVLSVAARPRS